MAKNLQYAKLADYLMSNVPGTDGILGVGEGTRVRSFRGKKMVDFMLDPKTKRKHGLEDVKTEADAMALCDKLLAATPALFLPCERLKEKHGGSHILKVIDPSKQPSVRRFDKGENGRYFWVHKGNQFWNQVKLAFLILFTLSCTMYASWPMFIRVIIWYIAVTILLILVGLTVLQLLLFTFGWVGGVEFWLLPHLWSDDVSIIEAFKPLYTFKKGEGNGYYRAGVLAVILSLLVWVGLQPKELEDFGATGSDIIKELYAGTLLKDNGNASLVAGGGAGSGGGGMFGARYGPGSYGGKVNTRIPDIQEIEKELELEEGDNSTVNLTVESLPRTDEEMLAEDAAASAAADLEEAEHAHHEELPHQHSDELASSAAGEADL